MTNEELKGKLIQIINMNGYPSYSNEVGRITEVRSNSTIVGTWGQHPILLGVDNFRFLYSNEEAFNALKENKFKKASPGLYVCNSENKITGTLIALLKEITPKEFCFIYNITISRKNLFLIEKDFPLNDIDFRWDNFNNYRSVNVRFQDKSKIGFWTCEANPSIFLKESFKEVFPEIYFKFIKTLKIKKESEEVNFLKINNLFNKIPEDDKLIIEID